MMIGVKILFSRKKSSDERRNRLGRALYMGLGGLPGPKKKIKESEKRIEIQKRR